MIMKLGEVRGLMERVSDMLDVCISEEEGEKEITFEQKVIYAVMQAEDGIPIRESLDTQDIVYCVKVLSEVYRATGIVLPKEWLRDE